MIIDVHAHWGPWFFSGLRTPNLTVMDRYGIDVAIVSSTEAVTYDPAMGNRALADFLLSAPNGSAPDRLLGYVTVHPRRLDQAERDLREFLPTRRFVGAKIHTEYTGSPVDSPQMRDALLMLAELDCPALVHTWDASVLDLARHCVDIPGLRVIAGHMGAGGHRHAIAAARSCDRLYLEPSWSHGLAGRMDEVLREVDSRQLLLGTDATLIDPASTFGVLAAARPDPVTAERIAWRNAAELFRLSGVTTGLA